MMMMSYPFLHNAIYSRTFKLKRTAYVLGIDIVSGVVTYNKLLSGINKLFARYETVACSDGEWICDYRTSEQLREIL